MFCWLTRDRTLQVASTGEPLAAELQVKSITVGRADWGLVALATWAD